MAQPHQVEVVTEALDRFLTPRPPRLLTGLEGFERLREAFSSREPEPDFEEGAQHRTLVMWRLARATSRIIGICAEDESLDQATEIDPSPWHNPIRPRITAAQQALIRRGSAAELLHYCAEGLPLLPPKKPAHARRWCAAMSILASDLGIGRTLEGLSGLQGFLTAKWCHKVSPTDEQVLAVEELLVDEAQRVIIENGERPAVEHFRSRYGFARKEAIGLIRLARADALVTGGSSVEEDRALMIFQLKDLIARAKEEMNTDKELKALKQLAAIQGLTRTEPEDKAADFMRVIAQVALRQDKQLMPPAPKALAAEYTVLDVQDTSDDDEDAEALAEFDKEKQL